MDPLKKLQKKFPGVEGSVIAMVYHSCENNVDLAAHKLEEMRPVTVSSVMRRKGVAQKNWETTRTRHHAEEWNGNGYGARPHSSSSMRSGNEAQAGIGSERKWSQNESRYQNGTYEDDMNHHEEGLYNREPGMGLSRMGMSHGSEYTYNMPGGMNYYDYYPEISGTSSGPVGNGMGTIPQVSPGMRMGAPGMGAPGMGMSRSTGVNSAHRLGQFHGNHHYQSPMMGGATVGPHPSSHHHMQQGQQYPMMIAPGGGIHPAQIPGQYPPNPRMMAHRQDDGIDHKMGMGSRRGYMGRPHPSMGQGRGVDLPRDRGDQLLEAKTKDQVKMANGGTRMVQKSLTSRENREGRRKMVILRGLPGSGKTTLARSLVDQHGVICSTDDFFIERGRYVFDPSKLSENHEKNKKKARAAMEMGKSPVIIDNTNTTAHEMKPYIVMAVKEFGYSVEIKEPTTAWRFKTSELARKNTHGITRQKLDRLLEKFEHRVSVESILCGSSVVVTSPSRAVSAPVATTSYGVQNFGKKTPLDSSSKYQKDLADRYGSAVADSQKPRENGGMLAVPGSSTKSGELTGEDERASSPEVRSSGSSNQSSPSSGGKGRGRGRSDSLPPAGRGRGLFLLGRRSGGGGVEEAEVGAGSRVVVEELMASKEELDGRKAGLSRQLVQEEDSVKEEQWRYSKRSKRGGEEENSEDLDRHSVPSQYHGLDFEGWEFRKSKSDSMTMETEGRKKGLWSEDKSVSKEPAGLSGRLPERKNVISIARRNLDISSKLDQIVVESDDMCSGQDKKGLVLEESGAFGIVNEDRNYALGKSGAEEWSTGNDVADGEVWSVAREKSTSLSMTKKIQEEKLSPTEKEEGSSEVTPDRTDADVWDSADEMDLSREEEEDEGNGTILGKNDEVEGKLVDAVAGGKLKHGRDIEAPPGLVSKGSSNKNKVAIGGFTKRALKELEGALGTTLFERYLKEGQMDEAKYSLKDQKKLVTQLIRENDKVRGGGSEQRTKEEEDLDEPKVSLTGDLCLSLESILERAQVDSLHTQLPNVLIERMFQDRQLVPRWKLDKVEERSEDAPSVEAAGKRSHNESRWLKFISRGKKEEEAEGLSSDVGIKGEEANGRKPASVYGSGMEPSSSSDGNSSEVDDPAIMHIVVAKQPPASKATVESLWRGGRELQHSVPVPSEAPKMATSSKRPSKSLEEEKRCVGASNLSWLSESPHWANPRLLSSALSKNSGALPQVGKESNVLPFPRGGYEELPPTEATGDRDFSVGSARKDGVGAFSLTVGSKSSSGSKLLSPSEQVFEEEKDLRNGCDATGRSEGRVLENFDRKAGGSSPRATAIGGKAPGSSKRKHGGGGGATVVGGGKEKESRYSLNSGGRNDLINLSEFPPLRRDLQTDEFSRGELEQEVMTFPSAIDEETGYGDLQKETSSLSGSVASSQKSASLQAEVASGGGSSDLDFLVECFPDLSRHHLQRLLEVNDGNVELTTISALSAQPDLGDDKPGSGLAATNGVLDAPTFTNRAGKKKSVSAMATVQRESKESSNSDGYGAVAVSDPRESSDTFSRDFQGVVNDEWGTAGRESMPQLVAWNGSVDGSGEHYLRNGKDFNEILEWDVALEDHEKLEEKKDNASSGNVVQDEAGFLQEDNLVLKLSDSLAVQLQALFGPIDQSLFQQGGTGSDFEVLLSEKAANQIYHKWVDTLQARAVEYQVRYGVPGVVVVPKGNLPVMGGARGGVSAVSGTIRSGNGLHSNLPGDSHVKGKPSDQQQKLLPPQQQSPKGPEAEPAESGGYSAARADAEHHASMRSQFFQKAAEARSSKKYNVASYYAQQGHMHTQKMRQANREAASVTLDNNNRYRPDNHIDLHGLHVNEAIAALSSKLSEKEGGELYVITGCGRGSTDGDPKIKPAVKKYLDHNKMRYEEKNSGLLRVVLK